MDNWKSETYFPEVLEADPTEFYPDLICRFFKTEKLSLAFQPFTNKVSKYRPENSGCNLEEFLHIQHSPRSKEY